MCRSIITLRTQDTVTDEEIKAAALQYVRKISGFRRPSVVNTEVFEKAVAEIAHCTQHLLDDLVIPPGGRKAKLASHSHAAAG